MSEMPIRVFLKKMLPPSAYGQLRKLRGAPARIFQSAMDQCGYVVARKSDYYSPLPSRREMKSTMARWTRPSSLLGVEYDLAEMKSRLTNLICRYHAEFMDLLPYEQACELGFGLGYSRLDAQILYAMLRAKKPAQYLEIGSGLSTYYASLAARRNASENRPMRITCVEPHPFAALKTIPDITVIEREVQSVGLGTFTALGANDVLFIDSSHIVRLDGDVPFLLLEVLPALNAGPLIHIHDIPFPYHGPYPADYWVNQATWPVWWNESMLLQALLCGNRSFSIALSAPLLRYHDEPFLKQFIPNYQDIDEEPNAPSAIWLKKV